MLWYAIASLTPAALIALACIWGGPFAGLAVLSITVLVYALDKIGHTIAAPTGSGHALSLTLAALHVPLLALGIWAIAGSNLGTLDKGLIYVALGLYVGQVSNSNAHELIHASARLPRRLGAAVYITLLHGHHVSAHLHVHHVHVATPRDPNSAPRGRGFWTYALRVFRDEFRAGLKAENARRARAQGTRPPHPYLFYVVGGCAALAVSYFIAGPQGLVAHLALASYAQLQLLVSDYVQHYGLQRRISETGKPEPVGPQHSWNAPKWYSSAMMLNAPKHSDHHMHPARRFPDLKVTPETMPVLPYSLPIMGALALVPPLWHRVMDRRVARWQNAA